VLDNHNYTKTTHIALLRQLPYPDGCGWGKARLHKSRKTKKIVR